MAEVRTTSATGGQKGTKLARFDLIPAGPLRELAEHYGRGAAKYADDQWRQGYEWRKSLAALARHENDFAAGKDYDVCSNEPDNCVPWDDGLDHEPDTCFNHTGSHHMAAVAWHAFLLLEFKDTHPEFDDRYRKVVLIDPATGTASGEPSYPDGVTEEAPEPDGSDCQEVVTGCIRSVPWILCPNDDCRTQNHDDTD